jgi:hypothetical protein
MKQYKIFKHPSGAIEAVKQGWSWPAFFAGILWAMVKRMWDIGIGVFLAFLVVGFIVGATAGEQGGDAIINGLGVTANLIFSVHGNSWREKNLFSRGFIQKQTVSATSPKAAIALYLKGETG